MGIYIRKILREKVRKLALDQEKSKNSRKKERKHDLDQEDKKVNTILTKKTRKKTRSWPRKRKKTRSWPRKKRKQDFDEEKVLRFSYLKSWAALRSRGTISLMLSISITDLFHYSILYAALYVILSFTLTALSASLGLIRLKRAGGGGVSWKHIGEQKPIFIFIFDFVQFQIGFSGPTCNAACVRMMVAVQLVRILK